MRTSGILAVYFTGILVGLLLGYYGGYQRGWRAYKINAAHEITLYDVICDVEHNTIHIRTGNYVGFVLDAMRLCPGIMPCPGTCTIQGASSTFTEELAR